MGPFSSAEAKGLPKAHGPPHAPMGPLIVRPCPPFLAALTTLFFYQVFLARRRRRDFLVLESSCHLSATSGGDFTSHCRFNAEH